MRGFLVAAKTLQRSGPFLSLFWWPRGGGPRVSLRWSVRLAELGGEELSMIGSRSTLASWVFEDEDFFIMDSKRITQATTKAASDGDENFTDAVGQSARAGCLQAPPAPSKRPKGGVSATYRSRSTRGSGTS